MTVRLARRYSVVHISDSSLLLMILFTEPEAVTRDVFLNIESILLYLSYLRPSSVFADAIP